MAGLKGRIRAWEEAKLLTAEQAAAILEYEDKHSKNRYFSGILTTGAIAIGLGVISLIAANWASINDTVKLSLFFLCWIGIAIYSYHAGKLLKSLQRETAATIFSIAFLAGVGLISQILNITSGSVFNVALLWIISMAPLVLTMQTAFLPSVWLLTFLSLPYFYLDEQTIDFFASQKYIVEHYSNALNALVFNSVFLAVLLSVRRALPIINPTLSKSWQQIALYSLTLGTSLYAVIAWTNNERTLASVHLYRPWLLLTASGICVVAFISIAKRIENSWGNAAVLLTAAFILAVPLISERALFSDLISFFASLLPLFAGLYSSMQLRQSQNFKVFSFLVGLRILIAYFEVLGSLAITAFGLISFGLLLIGVVLFGRKFMQSIDFKKE
jgi:uncharacterized membrane protein